MSLEKNTERDQPVINVHCIHHAKCTQEGNKAVNPPASPQEIEESQAAEAGFLVHILRKLNSQRTTRRSSVTYDCNINQGTETHWSGSYEQTLGWVTQHLRPDIWKQCISGNSGSTDHDEQHKVQEEYDECKNSNDGTSVAVGEVVYQSGGCACAHNDQMPCGSEMSVVCSGC